MTFWQTLGISLLSGIIGGTLAVIIDKTLIFGHEKIQKQKQLYGKLIGLTDLVCDCLLYNLKSRITLIYYRFWIQFGSSEAEKLSHEMSQIHLQYVKETEIMSSEKISELFETLGLIWATFPKNQELDDLINNCFKIESIPIFDPDPEGITNKDEIMKWRHEENVRIRQAITDKINTPLVNLIEYLHKVVIDSKK